MGAACRIRGLLDAKMQSVPNSESAETRSPRDVIVPCARPSLGAAAARWRSDSADRRRYACLDVGGPSAALCGVSRGTFAGRAPKTKSPLRRAFPWAGADTAPDVTESAVGPSSWRL